MVRKLILVGMLVMMGRGSVDQLYAAVCVSFICFTLQVQLRPYKHNEDNREIRFTLMSVSSYSR